MFNGNLILYQEAQEIIKKLNASGFAAYFAGGAVRDMLLNIIPSDIDIATNATPTEISQIFVNSKLVGAVFGVVIVKIREHKFEVATFRKDKEYYDGRHPSEVEFTSAEEDAKRRDFTVNSMFYDPIEKKVIDFVGGRKDLKNGVLRAIGDADTRFSEDYLRMIRAIRFASRLSFKIEKKTWNSIRKNVHNAANIAVERVREELSTCLMGKNPDNALQLMLDSGMLQIILPEIAKMKGIKQPHEFHPEGDVFEHTKLMLRQMAQDSYELQAGKTIKGATETTETLAWAVLFHDVGKPETMKIADRIRFDGHAAVGADIADRICFRLKFSNEMREDIENLVQNHMKFMEIMNMKLSTLKKFLQTENFDLHLALHRLDCIASHGDLSKIDFILDKIDELGEEQIKPAPILTGDDIIGLGIKRGPKIGEIIKDLEIQQLEGFITSRIEAINFVKERYITGK